MVLFYLLLRGKRKASHVRRSIFRIYIPQAKEVDQVQVEKRNEIGKNNNKGNSSPPPINIKIFIFYNPKDSLGRCFDRK